MDNHPIPQDVTGFQFKLVGNMTIKQFGYVCLGVVTAVILYYLPASGFGVFLKTIFIPLVGISGFIIAFVPIEGRSIDVMIGNFLRALVAPNQYVYHKTGRIFEFSNLPTAKQSAKKPSAVQTTADANKARQLSQLLTKHAQKQNKLDERETALLQALSLAPIPSSPPLQPQPAIAQPFPHYPPPAPKQEEQQKVQSDIQPQPKEDQHQTQTSASLAQAEDVLNQQLQQAKKDEQTQQATGVTEAAHQKVTLLERQVQALHFQRQQLEQQLMHLQNQLTSQQKAAPQHTPPATSQQPGNVASPNGAVGQQATQPTPASTQGGQKAQQDAAKRGLPHVPDTPNVIVGLVKNQFI